MLFQLRSCPSRPLSGRRDGSARGWHHYSTYSTTLLTTSCRSWPVWLSLLVLSPAPVSPRRWRWYSPPTAAAESWRSRSTRQGPTQQQGNPLPFSSVSPCSFRRSSGRHSTRGARNRRFRLAVEICELHQPRPAPHAFSVKVPQEACLRIGVGKRVHDCAP